MSDQSPSDQDSSTAKNQKPRPAARRRSRRFALQALYQWQIAKMPMNEVEAQFRVNFDMHKADIRYFHDLISSIEKQVEDIDKTLEPYLDINISEVDPIELNVLRIGAFELLHRVDIPYRVSINEAIELVKKFGGEESHKFVNGVLDRLAAKARAIELKAHKSQDSDQ